MCLINKYIIIIIVELIINRSVSWFPLNLYLFIILFFHKTIYFIFINEPFLCFITWTGLTVNLLDITARYEFTGNCWLIHDTYVILSYLLTHSKKKVWLHIPFENQNAWFSFSGSNGYIVLVFILNTSKSSVVIMLFSVVSYHILLNNFSMICFVATKVVDIRTVTS